MLTPMLSQASSPYGHRAILASIDQPLILTGTAPGDVRGNGSEGWRRHHPGIESGSWEAGTRDSLSATFVWNVVRHSRAAVDNDEMWMVKGRCNPADRTRHVVIKRFGFTVLRAPVPCSERPCRRNAEERRRSPRARRHVEVPSSRSHRHSPGSRSSGSAAPEGTRSTGWSPPVWMALNSSP